MREVGKPRLDAVDVPEKPVEDVDEVAELGEQRAAVQFHRALPRNLAVVTVVPVPETIDLHHVNAAQPAGVHHVLQPFTRGTVPVLHHTEHLLAHLQRLVQHGLSVLSGQRHRLLHDDVVAVVEGSEGLLCMESIGRTDAHHIHIAVGLEHGREVGVIGEILAGLSLLPRPNVATGHEFATGMAAHHLSVALSDVAQADHGKSKGGIRHVTGSVRFTVRSGAQKWRIQPALAACSIATGT